LRSSASSSWCSSSGPVYNIFRKFQRDGVWETIWPSCIWRCAADGPGGQPLGCGSRQPIGQVGGKRGGKDNQVGYDAGKQVKGRKIHALVDSEGLPMGVVVHSAAIQDRDGAVLVLDKIRRRSPWLELIWADGGYNTWQVEAAVAKVPLLRIEIVKRSDDMKGFVVLPRRWVGRAHLLLVRTKPASRQRLREPCRDGWPPSSLSPPSSWPSGGLPGRRS
jgi:transposase